MYAFANAADHRARGSQRSSRGAPRNKGGASSSARARPRRPKRLRSPAPARPVAARAGCSFAAWTAFIQRAPRQNTLESSPPSQPAAPSPRTAQTLARRITARCLRRFEWFSAPIRPLLCRPHCPRREPDRSPRSGTRSLRTQSRRSRLGDARWRNVYSPARRNLAAARFFDQEAAPRVPLIHAASRQARLAGRP